MTSLVSHSTFSMSRPVGVMSANVDGEYVGNFSTFHFRQHSSNSARTATAGHADCEPVGVPFRRLSSSKVGVKERVSLCVHLSSMHTSHSHPLYTAMYFAAVVVGVNKRICCLEGDADTLPGWQCCASIVKASAGSQSIHAVGKSRTTLAPVVSFKATVLQGSLCLSS